MIRFVGRRTDPGRASGRGALLALCLLALSGGGSLVSLSAQTTLIRAEKVYTGTDEGVVGPRFILVESGRIVSVGNRRPRNLPASVPFVEAAFVTPGLIDARTTLGLSGIHPDDDDQDETSGPNQAHLRALDAFDPTDGMVDHALRGGVTVVQSAPGDANSIGGQAGIFKLGVPLVSEALVRAPSALVFSLDETAKLTYGSANRLPSTRMANVGIIRQALLDAGRYRGQAAAGDASSRDLRKEALAAALDRELPVLVSAERADELATALRLAEEFGLDLRIVGATEAGVVLDRLASSDVPVLLGPPGDAVLTAEGGAVLQETAARLRDRDVPFVLVTGDDEDAARVNLMDVARWAAGGGLTIDQALAAVTISPARLMGLDGDLGSIEEGKTADLVLFDGDPMVATTHVTAVFVNGGMVVSRAP